MIVFFDKRGSLIALLCVLLKSDRICVTMHQSPCSIGAIAVMRLTARWLSIANSSVGRENLSGDIVEMSVLSDQVFRSDPYVGKPINGPGIKSCHSDHVQVDT